LKKITRTVTKQVEETVRVCDTCEQVKLLPIEGNWATNCRYDNCYDNYGRFEFCSVRCFVAGAEKALQDIGDEDTSWFESLSIGLDSSFEEFEAFVTFLKEYKGE
jgi:hypothetical protein